MLDYLPSSVLIEILARLPVKLLLRLRCVCKRWYSLISNPVFISTHLNQSLSNSNNNEPLVVKYNNMFPEMERFEIDSENDSSDEYEEFEGPVRIVNKSFRIVGSCNGLICLSHGCDTYTDTDTVIVWNPSVRRSVTLPKPEFPYGSQGTCLVGFGFDPLTNDYKILRIIYQHHISDDQNYRVPPKVEIYAFRTGIWSSICGAAPMYVVYDSSPAPAFVNGAIHWVASDRGEEGGFRNLIVAFDVGAEVFREIMMPDSLAKTEVLKLSIAVLGTSIALVQYEEIGESECCWVWTMKEYGAVESWTRLFTINFRGCPVGIRKVLGFQKNKVVLSVGLLVLSYDPNIQRYEYQGVTSRDDSFYVYTYVESLVLLEGENRALQLANSCEAVSGEGECPVLGEEDGTEEQHQPTILMESKFVLKYYKEQRIIV